MYYISHILLCLYVFSFFIIKITVRCRCMWKWNFRTNFTQSFGHFVTFHIHTCMNSYYIAYYYEELDHFPPLLNGVNVVGCGSASLPTWITHSLRLHWQCALQVFGVTCIAGEWQVLVNARQICCSTHFPSSATHLVIRLPSGMQRQLCPCPLKWNAYAAAPD